MRKRVIYTPDSGDLLMRYVTLADLQDFVEGIVRDNPGADPQSVQLRMDSLQAELMVTV